MSKPMSLDEIACRTMDGIGSARIAPADFLAKHERHIERDPLYGCWIWISRLDRDGYGTLWGKDGPRQAHRAVYLELVGPIGDGLVLDHLCRRRACVRPAHLEPVKGSINDLRRRWAVRCRRTRCPNGHDLSTCITTIEGGRLCRVCMGPEESE